MTRKQEYDVANRILAEWNPIEVSTHIAQFEYTSYVPRLAEWREDREGIYREMIKIIREDIGLEFDESDQDHVSHTRKYANELYEMFQS